MSLINVVNLSFSYSGSAEYVFKDVSFSIDTDFKLGLVGRNGRGKSTFLKLLCGQYEYSGKISAESGFDYFPYEPKDKSVLALDAAEGAVGAEFEEWRLIRELNLMGEDAQILYRPFSTLSGGEQTKVLLAALFIKQNNFLLIDEPTNHLDTVSRVKIGDYLAKKKGFILVSHERALLDKCTDHILSINRSNIELTKGNYSVWEENKKRRDIFERSENEKLENEIDKLKTAAARRSDNAAAAEKEKYGASRDRFTDRGFLGAKAASLMKSAKNLEKRLDKSAEQKSTLLKNIERTEALKLSPLLHRSERLIEAKNLSVFYGNNQIFEPLDFEILNGERVALSGKNGSGKSSVLKLILGEKIAHSGTLFLASGIIISYVPQDASYLQGGLRPFVQKHGLDETFFRAILSKLDFSRAQLEEDMSGFSAGQKKKLLLAKSLSEKAHIYIWDEPLNYIDIHSRIQLEELILKYSPTLLFVEHDETFVEKISTKKVVLQ